MKLTFKSEEKSYKLSTPISTFVFIYLLTIIGVLYFWCVHSGKHLFSFYVNLKVSLLTSHRKGLLMTNALTFVHLKNVLISLRFQKIVLLDREFLLDSSFYNLNRLSIVFCSLWYPIKCYPIISNYPILSN